MNISIQSLGLMEKAQKVIPKGLRVPVAVGATAGETGGGRARLGTTGARGRSAAEEGAWPRRGARPGRRGAASVVVGAGARRARWAARA